MNSDGSHLVQLTWASGGFTTTWDISPDGKTVAVNSDQDFVPGSNSDHSFEFFLFTLVP